MMPREVVTLGPVNAWQSRWKRSRSEGHSTDWSARTVARCGRLRAATRRFALPEDDGAGGRLDDRRRACATSIARTRGRPVVSPWGGMGRCGVVCAGRADPCDRGASTGREAWAVRPPTARDYREGGGGLPLPWSGVREAVRTVPGSVGARLAGVPSVGVFMSRSPPMVQRGIQQAA